MRVRSVLLGTVITLALVCALVFACVGGIVAAPYVQRQMGAFRTNSAAPISRSNEVRPAAPAQVVAAPQVTPAPTPTAVPLQADASASERTASDVYRKVSPSVVYIQVTQSGGTSNFQHPQVPGFPPNAPSQPRAACKSPAVRALCWTSKAIL